MSSKYYTATRIFHVFLISTTASLVRLFQTGFSCWIVQNQQEVSQQSNSFSFSGTNIGVWTSVKMAVDITGRWNHYHSENFDEYLKAVGKYSINSKMRWWLYNLESGFLGVNFILRKLITSMAASTLEITKDGDEYTLSTISAMKTIQTKFKLDQEFDDKLMDGRECKVCVSYCKKISHEYLLHAARIPPRRKTYGCYVDRGEVWCR